MSTLRVSNIEAKADPSSPSVDEKLKVTNSNGDILVHIDGKTAGITTVGINTTDKSFTVDAAQNVEFLGIVTATKFSLSGGGEITGGDGNFTGIVTSGSGNFTGGLSVGTAVTAATANFTSSLTAASANFTGNVSIAGTLTYEDVTNVDSVGIATARTGIDVTGGHIDLIDNSKIRVGTGDDLQVYHDGTDTWIDNDEGDLYIRNTGDDIIIRAADDVLIQTQASEGAIIARGDGQVELYHNNSKKLETISSGAKITGVLEVTQEYPSIRPTLDLNFAATKTLDRRITFTRDTIGTYIDELGIVKYASNNTPRFDHDPVTGESLGLLIEESETNYIPYSNGIGSGWGNNGTYTNTVTDVNAPDGTAGVTEFLERNTGAYHATYYQTVSVNGSSQYTLSAWLKKGSNYDTNANGTGSYQIYCSRGTGSTASIVIDPTFTTITSSNTDSGSITQYPNGWIRVSFTFTSNASANVTPHFLFGGGGSYTGNGTNNVYVWGIQFERNSFPSSYIPTNGAETTRASDFATIKGTNFIEFYNQTEGTLFGEFTIKDTTYSSAAIVNINQELDSSYAYSIMFAEVGTANGYFGRTYKNSSGVNISNSSSVLNSLHPSTTPQKVTFGYTTVSGGELRAYWNGNNVNGSSDLSKVPTTLTNMRIGRGWTGTDVINAHIRKLSYYNRRLPNAQLQGLTQQ